MPHFRPRWTLASVVAVVLSTAAASAPAQSSAPATGGGIHALGRLLPETGLIAVGSRPGQRIDQIPVAIGDDVPAGATLAILEGRAQAEAQLALAELQKRQVDFQRRAKIDQFALEREKDRLTSEPNAQAAAAVADALRKLLDRATPLYKIGDAAATVAPGTIDRAKLEDEGRYVELLAKTTKAELDRKLLDVEKELRPKRTALEDSMVARDDAAAKTAGNPDFLLPDAQIALARANLEATEVKAPRAGKILDVLARPGEVGTGQLLLLGDVSRMVAVAEVFQTDVLRVRVGDPATVAIAGQTVAGKVSRVGSVVGRNQAANMDPRALKDVRVVKVWVALDDPALASRLVDMEAEVVITPSEGH